MIRRLFLLIALSVSSLAHACATRTELPKPKSDSELTFAEKLTRNILREAESAQMRR